MNLDTAIQNIKRIQPAYQKRLLKLGIRTLRDLFYHFPHRYNDFSKITPIADLKINDVTTVKGKIIDIKTVRTWHKRMIITQALIKDSSGIIKVVWFNQPFLANTLKKDTQISLSGKVNFNKAQYLSNPAYEKLTMFNNDLRHTGRLIPIYPETTGLSSRYLRYLIQISLPTLNQINDWLPSDIKRSQKLLELHSALKQIHFPASNKAIIAAKRRLAFEELFLIQLFTLRQKIKWQKKHSWQIFFNKTLIKDFVSRLPFKLTNAQRQAVWEILQDLNKIRPMNRLLGGDVGSGKTVVAAIAALETTKAGGQTAFMAPTEILVRQHFATISKLLSEYDLEIGILTGSETKISSGGQITECKKSKLFENIKNGKIDIVVGTHTLIQKEIKFKKLMLAVVDEQHRFGVKQRSELQKNVIAIKDGAPQKIPHLLSMTATPIPRTLALAIYGDLDMSLLNEIPHGRQKIITRIVAPTDRHKTYEFIRQQVKTGRQIFVICPRIETNEKERNGIRQDRKQLPFGVLQNKDEIKTVKEEYRKLSQDIFPDFKIAMLHSKIKPKEKIMADFAVPAGKRKIDILISTSIVEVGIDVPNATVMLIEGAERFGLAQLHQFRGRVGRGPHQSFCFLFTDSASQQTKVRLKALLNCRNGFELAEKDLELRGPGEFFGTRQWGLPDLSMASLTDMELTKEARWEAIKILQKDRQLKNYPLLKEKLNNFKKDIHLE